MKKGNEPLVGTSPPRLDGAAKVTGKALYVDDYLKADALFGATIRSDVPRGTIVGITQDPAFDWSDVVIVTKDDIPGPNVVALIEQDQPILAEDVVRHAYEPIALVACADPHKLARAKAALQVHIAPEPAVLSIADALLARTKICGEDNVQKRYLIEHELGGSDIDAIIARCDIQLTETYDVHHQEQLYIEPQGVLAWWSDAGVHVAGSIQCPYYVHKAMVAAFAEPGDRVHISQAVTGGGFGGKEEYPSIIAMHAALLSKKAGRPVRLIYDRKEDIEATTKRHPARVTLSAGITKDGELVALSADCVMDGGAYVTLSPVVLSRGVLHAAGAYRWKHARIEGRCVATNTPPNGAFRGFGAPQTIWAIERHMDRLAERVGMDPLDFKRKNLLGIGSTTVTGQVLKESVGVEECIEKATRAANYTDKRAAYARQPVAGEARKRRGIGLSIFCHGAGFTGSGERRLKGKVAVDCTPEGRLVIRTASTDIGQGTETVFRQIAADAAGLELGDVDFEIPCTTRVPDSGPTVASRTVMVVGSIVAQAAKAVVDAVRGSPAAKGAKSFAEAARRATDAHGGAISELVQYEPPVAVAWNDDTYRGDAYPAFSWACDIAEVEVDLDTYEVKLLGFWAAQDIGKAIHPVLCAGQVEGGTLQAIGWALYEDVVWKDGLIQNPRMTNYVIPTSQDAPTFETFLVEHPFSGGPMGAKGVGELPMDGGAPAIAAAVDQALGVSVKKLPMLPERLFELAQPSRAAT